MRKIHNIVDRQVKTVSIHFSFNRSCENRVRSLTCRIHKQPGVKSKESRNIVPHIHCTSSARYVIELAQCLQYCSTAVLAVFNVKINLVIRDKRSNWNKLRKVYAKNYYYYYNTHELWDDDECNGFDFNCRCAVMMRAGVTWTSTYVTSLTTPADKSFNIKIILQKWKWPHHSIQLNRFSEIPHANFLPAVAQ